MVVGGEAFGPRKARAAGRAMLALLLATSSAAHAASVLQRVDVSRASTVSVALHLSAPVHPLVRRLPGDAEHPARVYLDLPNTIVDDAAPAVVDGDARMLLRVRTGRFDASTARVVLDLASALDCRVGTADTTVTVELLPPRPAAAAPASSPHPSRPAPVVATVPAIAPAPEAAAASGKAAPAVNVSPPTPTTDGALSPPSPPLVTPPPAEASRTPASSPEASASAEPSAIPSRMAAATPPPASAAAAPTPPDAPTAPYLSPPGTIPPDAFPQVATASAEPPPAPPMHPRPGPPFALTPPPPPVERPLVVLDAGHGGYDPGAIGLGGIVEKAVTLDLVERVAARLREELRVDVVLTRDDDTFVPIEARVARAWDASLFVSLHANAAENPRLRGVEVFYGGGGIDAAAAGPSAPERLGRDVAQSIERRFAPIRTTVRPGRFGVIMRNAVPSILIEVGYLTNPADVARIGDENQRGLVAQAIADGVAAFVRTSGNVRRSRRPVAALGHPTDVRADPTRG